VIEALLAGVALYLFVAHIFTHEHPFIEPALFKDRNFSVGLVFIFIVGVILLATMALLPPFMQNLMGYPVIDVGVLLAPRGVGTMFAMIAVGACPARWTCATMIALGLLLTSLSMWEMTQFNTDIHGLGHRPHRHRAGVGAGFHLRAAVHHHLLDAGAALSATKARRCSA
jgi:DHA2 family multidrug resistance protein